MAKLASTKVQGFWFFSIVATILILLDKIGGGEYVALVTLIFSIFSTANVAQKKVMNYE